MGNQYKYTVCIHCMTYNHEKYLVDALEGFVMQKTNFPFVAIVHDDASTDGTADILRKYAEKYPDIIHPIYETENQYSKRDGSLGRIMNEAIAATGAKYIAMCEGDDYWTDPYKLQKQVDFLESHPDYGLCCGKARVLNQESQQVLGYGGTFLCESYHTIVRGANDIYTATSMMRTNLYLSCRRDFDNFLPFELRIDTSIWYWFAYNSKIKYFDECFCTYRILPESASHTKDLRCALEMDFKFLKLKLFFISHFPILNPEENAEVISIIMDEIRVLGQQFAYIKETEIRSSRAYKLGKKIMKSIRWIKKLT